MYKILFLINLIGSSFFYHALAYSSGYDSSCRNPFLMHDVPYVFDAWYPSVSYTLNHGDDYVCSIPDNEIRDIYIKMFKIKEYWGKDVEWLYPSTYKAFYDLLVQYEGLKTGSIFEGTLTEREEGYELDIYVEDLREDNGYNYHLAIVNMMLEIEGIKDLEELKNLAETKGDEPLKGNDLYFYKFPEEFFTTERQDIVFNVNVNTYSSLWFLKTEGGYSLLSDNTKLKGLPNEGYQQYLVDYDNRLVEEPQQHTRLPYFPLQYYFDYSIFFKCLEEGERLNMCMEHNFILTAYLQSMLLERKGFFVNIWEEATQEELFNILDNLFQNNISYENFMGEQITGQQKNLLSGYTKEDFLSYLEAKNIRYFARNKFLSYKDFLSNKLQEIAIFGETQENKLTRQDKLDYLYFKYFAEKRPDFIKKDEYEQVSRFYFGKEDIYQSLHELIKDQEISELENPLFYSVLYGMIVSLDTSSTKSDPIPELLSIEIEGQKYKLEDLDRICKLYHESLDKALQGATEERRRAFEEKNIQVCEI